MELYLARDPLKAGIRQLVAAKVEIEAEMGETLEWQELNGKRASRIGLFKRDVDPFVTTQQPAIQEWMLDRMLRFRKVFSSRVKALDFDLIEPEHDDVRG